MIYGYRYIDVSEDGQIITFKDTPTENSIDIEGMTIPEMPTDAIYALRYNKTSGLHWAKTGDFPQKEPTQLDRIEAAVVASNEQIAQEARDAYTLELIEGGVIA